eukprot:831903-Prymnesium_polylepis.1
MNGLSSNGRSFITRLASLALHGVELHGSDSVTRLRRRVKRCGVMPGADGGRVRRDSSGAHNRRDLQQRRQDEHLEMSGRPPPPL